mmetsp:Transcript_144942/g.278167  ORF Transcript_144942/g.278167 Transcript_144942/m.278167 type:complete len:127 (+) Transcript_144942:349-729(+)
MREKVLNDILKIDKARVPKAAATCQWVYTFQKLYQQKLDNFDRSALEFCNEWLAKASTFLRTAVPRLALSGCTKLTINVNLDFRPRRTSRLGTEPGRKCFHVQLMRLRAGMCSLNFNTVCLHSDVN